MIDLLENLFPFLHFKYSLRFLSLSISMDRFIKKNNNLLRLFAFLLYQSLDISTLMKISRYSMKISLSSKIDTTIAYTSVNSI